MSGVTFSSGNIIDQLCSMVNQLNYNVCQLSKQVCALQNQPTVMSTFTQPTSLLSSLPALPSLPSLPSLPAIAYLYEQVDNNTNPTDTPRPGIWVVRTFNTLEEKSTSTGITLSENTFTLPIGMYELLVRCPATNVGEHQIQLYNVTSNTTESYGSSAQAVNSSSDSWLMYTLAVTEPSSYQIQHITTNVGSFGTPGNHGTPEKYSQMSIRAYV